nr:unnamed protein product [Spirometra erinaceieuropaei]
MIVLLSRRIFAVYNVRPLWVALELTDIVYILLVKDKKARKRINRSILTWNQAQSRTCWGVLILMGGGFALSKIASVGGLSKVISGTLEFVRSVQPFGLVYLITFFGATLTEVVSNSATVTILVPIMFDLAKAGIILNIVTQLIVVVCTMTYGMVLFQMNKIPSWA